MPRRFPPPWKAEKIPGGYVVRDANGQAMVYVYSRATEAEALQAKVLTEDEASGGLCRRRWLDLINSGSGLRRYDRGAAAGTKEAALFERPRSPTSRETTAIAAT
jgi:hypothetical protein